MKQKEIFSNLEKTLYRYSSFNRKKGKKLMVGLNAMKLENQRFYNKKTKRYYKNNYIIVRFEYGMPKDGKVILNDFKIFTIFVADKRLLDNYYHKTIDLLENFKEKVKVLPLETRIFNVNKSDF